MAVMSLGRLMSKVGGVVQEDSPAEELLAKDSLAEELLDEETKVLMDNTVDEGEVEAEILSKELVKRRRKPPPYMIKLFKDHTR